jgi:hypothetical protein
MFGILAIVTFIIDFFLRAGNVSTNSAWLSFPALTALGLAFLAVHLVYPWKPWR